MPVKYIYKNHRPIAQIWTKETDMGTMFIAGALILAVAGAGIAWWKINRG